MRVTINDIARVSGYSKTSVSFAFNDPGRISNETREKILRVAEELGYVPDPVARNLSTRKIGTIGFLLPQTISNALQNPYLTQVLSGVGQVCHEKEYSLTLVPPLRGAIVDGVRSAAVDAFITLGLQPEMKVVQLIRQRHVPFVTIDGRQDEEIPSINIDDEDAAYREMRFVLDRGHVRIAIASLEEPGVSDADSERFPGVNAWRLQGFRRALKESGNTFPVLQLRSVTSIEGGRRLAGELLGIAKTSRPTALVCMSDIVAIGAMLGFRDAGLAVPEEISVIGFDDIPEASIVCPGLSTVAQPGIEKGVQAAEMLFKLLDHGELQTHVSFATSIVERGSVRTL